MQQRAGASATKVVTIDLLIRTKTVKKSKSKKDPPELMKIRVVDLVAEVDSRYLSVSPDNYGNFVILFDEFESPGVFVWCV